MIIEKHCLTYFDIFVLTDAIFLRSSLPPSALYDLHLSKPLYHLSRNVLTLLQYGVICHFLATIQNYAIHFLHCICVSGREV
jgi:hypothetical protein